MGAGFQPGIRPVFLQENFYEGKNRDPKMPDIKSKPTEATLAETVACNSEICYFDRQITGGDRDDP